MNSTSASHIDNTPNDIPVITDYLGGITPANDNVEEYSFDLADCYGLVPSLSLKVQDRFRKFSNKYGLKYLNPRLAELRSSPDLSYSETVEAEIRETLRNTALVLAFSTLFIPAPVGSRPAMYGITWVYSMIRIKIHKQIYAKFDRILEDIEEEIN